jgi:predicted dehydrogenase
MRRLRVGLMGCGRIAQRAHRPALAAMPGVALAAVAEPEAAAREACRVRAPGAALFGDYRDLLERGRLDAVVICLPPALHAEAAVAAFERGLHVYLEKPLATTLEDGERVVDAWRRAGTVGWIGFNHRFHPLVGALRAALRAGVLGEVTAVRTVFGAARRGLPAWKRERGSGGGALLDLATHHIDLVRFVLGGEIARVAALVRSVETEDDTAALALGLETGPLVTMLTSLTAVEEDRIEVHGARGQLVLDRYRSRRLLFRPARRDFGAGARLRAVGSALASLPGTLLDAANPPRQPSLALALAAFAATARRDAPGGRADAPEGRAQAPDLEEGLRSLAVVAAAERAARSGLIVALGDPVPAGRTTA